MKQRSRTSGRWRSTKRTRGASSPKWQGAMKDSTADLIHAAWNKSSHSNGEGACVEVASGVSDVVPVRDSKHPSGPVLTFSAASWSSFVTDVKETKRSV
ncbi:DUF397 domain-containing protein [Streptomyces gamaensis]|uniref:DUF397 domain-containing protein n=1 Tax=Streptomyces gamaensis TaxID=1763542 RepID=A0ABW0Z235_9ACTN